jgi:D-sedoheptulose 7-phosphate isomerase
MNASIVEMLACAPDLAPCVPELERAFEVLRGTFRAGNKLLLCGNGGSAADCEHMVGELMKGFRARRPIPEADRERLAALFRADGGYLGDRLQGALPAISLSSQTSLLTATANDVAADLIFAQQVYGYGRPGDALLAISTSGRSANVLHAVRVARALRLRTIGLSGPDGGRLVELCDGALCPPRRGVAAIQQAHQALYHTLCAMLEDEFFGGGAEPLRR